MVYIYLTILIKDIKYLCKVLETDVKKESIQDTDSYALNDNVGKYVALEMIEEYDEKVLNYETLKKCKLSKIQVPSRANGILVNYINNVRSKALK